MQDQARLQLDEFSETARYYSLNEKQARDCIDRRLPYVAAVLAERRDVRDCVVMEVSAGSGLMALALKERFPNIRLFVTEYAARRFEHASYRGLDAHKCACGMEHLPFDGETVDCLFCNGVLHHVQDVHASLHEVCRVLRPGGAAVLIEPNRLNPFYALLAAMKPPERGILTTDYDAVFHDLLRDAPLTLEERRFTSYSTFHGGITNRIAELLSRLAVLPMVWRPLRSHRVFILRRR